MRRDRGGLRCDRGADRRRCRRPCHAGVRRRGLPRRDARDAAARSDRIANRSASAMRRARRLRAAAPRFRRSTDPDFDVDGRTIVLVDDVINSGWTVQRAMTTLWQRGRPADGQARGADRSRPSRAADSAQLRRQEYSDRARRSRAGAPRPRCRPKPTRANRPTASCSTRWSNSIKEPERRRMKPLLLRGGPRDRSGSRASTVSMTCS